MRETNVDYVNVSSTKPLVCDLDESQVTKSLTPTACNPCYTTVTILIVLF